MERKERNIWFPVTASRWRLFSLLVSIPVPSFPFGFRIPVPRSSFSVFRFPFSVFRFPFSVFRSPFSVLRSPFPVPRSPFPVPRSSFPVPRSPFPVPRSSFLVPRSSFLVPRSSFLVLYFFVNLFSVPAVGLLSNSTVMRIFNLNLTLTKDHWS